MTEEVLVKICGKQRGEDGTEDVVETMHPGEYRKKEGTHFLLYDEYLEGVEEPVKNILRLKGEEVNLTKRGPLNVRMTFEPGREHRSSYQTPYGVLMMGTDTSRVDFVEKEDKILLSIWYVLKANDAFVADCNIQIEILAKKERQ